MSTETRRPEEISQGTTFAKNKKVILLHNELLKESYRFNKERLVIGSVESADIRLTGDGISPIHAVLELNYDAKTDSCGPAVYDLASGTGVFVNGSKVLTQLLKNGDVLTVGMHKLSFRIEDLSRMVPATRKTESEGRRLFMNPDEDLRPLLLSDAWDEGYEVQQIFDYRPTTKPALEVVMSWMGAILDVEHFSNAKRITVGNTRDCDFAIPSVLSEVRFPIVTQENGNYTLRLDPKMKGVLQRKGSLQPLDQIQGGSGEYGRAVPIEQDDFAKIAIGDVDFYLSFTMAPPRLKIGKMLERDPLLIKIFLGSMAMTAAIIAVLANTRVPVNLEAEQIPDRIATILYQPEKYTYEPDRSKIVQEQEQEETKPTEPKKPPPAPVKLDITPNASNEHKPVPKEMNVAPKPVQHKGSKQSQHSKGKAQGQNQAKEGAGARAKGEEGKRGSTQAHASGAAQSKATRASPQGGQGSGAGNAQVPDEGNVDVLKGMTDKIQNILGNSAASLGKGGEKLKGFGGFNTAGNGGLALEGNGKGGGGNAETTLGGLSNHGRGGGRVGTGLGAAGSGNGIVGGQSRVVIRSGGPEEAVVMGAIDADAVEAALLAHKDEFRLCYEREINAENPNLAGRVGTNFVIGSSGRVDQAGIESTTLHNANTERCIVQVIKRIDFPIPRGAGTVQVTYPFKFTPVGH